ncbi:MAG TPA: hypothetical protein VLZ89_10655 [Anaerolineales bacterium]|nr:hypothetical protein [Anaerolineales bacterium]
MNRSFLIRITPFLRGTASRRGAIFGAILLSALLAFEVFNYSTTAFALTDLLGNLKFAGITWATVLAFAFCGIDFAGIARIFTPQSGRDEPTEVWYLFGAWLIAALFNAALTWWGVSVAIMDHTSQGSALIGEAVLVKAVPVFVAAMVLLIRVLIIGTFSIAGENIFSMAEDQPSKYQPMRPPFQARPPSVAPTPSYMRPAPKPAAAFDSTRAVAPPEPTYHPVGMSARASDGNRTQRR